MTDRSENSCPVCWADADAVARILGGTHEDRYAELLRAKHSESDADMVSPW